MVGALCLIAAIGYWVTGRRPLRLYGAAWRWTGRTWRTAAFLLAILLIALLAGPLDAIARHTFWLRTAQLVLLLMVASPLLVLGAPGSRFARLSRRGGAHRGSGRLRSIATLMIFSAALVAAYLPPIYRLTAPAGIIRQLAQIFSLMIGYAFWAQVIAQPGRMCSLSHIGRVAYLFASSAQVRILGLILGFAPVPFYQVPLIDQQLAAGILMVPGILTDLIALTACLYLWLAQDERRHRGGSDTGGQRQGMPVIRREALRIVRPLKSA